MKTSLAIIALAFSLAGCGTLGGIASDVNAFTNARYERNYYSPPQYYRYDRGWGHRGWGHGRRW